jgi:Sugar-specific transcriptional regulator TrmB
MYRSRTNIEADCLKSGLGPSPRSHGSSRPLRAATGGRSIERRGSSVPIGRTDTVTDAAERATRYRASTEPSPDSVARPPDSPAMVVSSLRLLGLSTREAKMFFALLRDPLGAREASEVAGLHRATGYRVLLRLLDRGLVAGNGRNPQAFRAVSPSALFRRLELFYRDETEIPGYFAEAMNGTTGPTGGMPGSFPLPHERPWILGAEGRATHPAIVALSEAKRSVTAIVRPLATPISYRMALAKALGQLARSGVNVRLLTDATPADYRFCRTVHRESGGSIPSLLVRHYCPIACHAYTIDRQRVLRMPSLGASSRSPPLAVVIDDPGRVRAQVSRFEGLWAEGFGAVQPLRSTHGAGSRISTDPWVPSRADGDSQV